MSKTSEIQFFIADSARLGQQNIVRSAAEKFGITRQAVLLHIRQMIADGILTATGATKARRYEILPKRVRSFVFKKVADLKEDVVWREAVLPFLAGAPENAIRICDYGFTEMFNNAIEHSGADAITVNVEHLHFWLRITIQDN